MHNLSEFRSIRQCFPFVSWQKFLYKKGRSQEEPPSLVASRKCETSLCIFGVRRSEGGVSEVVVQRIKQWRQKSAQTRPGNALRSCARPCLLCIIHSYAVLMCVRCRFVTFLFFLFSLFVLRLKPPAAPRALPPNRVSLESDDALRMECTSAWKRFRRIFEILARGQLLTKQLPNYPLSVSCDLMCKALFCIFLFSFFISASLSATYDNNSLRAGPLPCSRFGVRNQTGVVCEKYWISIKRHHWNICCVCSSRGYQKTCFTRILKNDQPFHSFEQRFIRAVIFRAN